MFSDRHCIVMASVINIVHTEQRKYLERIRERVFEDTEDGTPVERFHYYEGLPDGIGKRHDGY